MPMVIKTSAKVNPKFNLTFRQDEKTSDRVNPYFTLSLCERVEFVSELYANLQIRESGFADGRRETSPDSEQIEPFVA